MVLALMRRGKATEILRAISHTDGWNFTQSLIFLEGNRLCLSLHCGIELESISKCLLVSNWRSQDVYMPGYLLTIDHARFLVLDLFYSQLVVPLFLPSEEHSMVKIF